MRLIGTSIVASAVLMVSLSGCGKSAQSRYYLLAGMHDVPVSELATPSLVGKTVGVGPLEFPSYLDRVQVVTRAAGHELQIAEFDRWASPLKEQFLSVLAGNLADLLETEQVFVQPWKSRVEFDYRVALDVVRFDTSSTGLANLDVRWSVVDRNGSAVVPLRRSTLTQELSNSGYSAAADALSLVLADLSQEIAKAIRTVS